MDTVFLDKKTLTIKYENSWDENLIEIETDKNPSLMTYDEVVEWVKELVEKYITK